MTDYCGWIARPSETFGELFTHEFCFVLRCVDRIVSRLISIRSVIHSACCAPHGLTKRQKSIKRISHESTSKRIFSPRTNTQVFSFVSLLSSSPCWSTVTVQVEMHFLVEFVNVRTTPPTIYRSAKTKRVPFSFFVRFHQWNHRLARSRTFPLLIVYQIDRRETHIEREGECMDTFSSGANVNKFIGQTAAAVDFRYLNSTKETIISSWNEEKEEKKLRLSCAWLRKTDRWPHTGAECPREIEHNRSTTVTDVCFFYERETHVLVLSTSHSIVILGLKCKISSSAAINLFSFGVTVVSLYWPDVSIPTSFLSRCRLLFIWLILSFFASVSSITLCLPPPTIPIPSCLLFVVVFETDYNDAIKPEL